MVAEKFNLPLPDEESSSRPDWQALRPIPLAAFEGPSDSQESADTRIASVLSLGDEVIWQRPEGDAAEEVEERRDFDRSQSEADKRNVYEVHDSASQPTAEAYQSIGSEDDKPPMTPPPIPMPSRSPELAPVQSARYENTLGKRELLRVAKDVKIDGISLKDIYEAGRIDEEGLRSIVGSYLRGGDVRKQLTKELIVKERSYERDPSLRHARLAEEQERRSKRGSRADRNESGLLASLGLGGVLESVQGVAQNAGKTAKSAGGVVTRGAKIVQHDLIDNSNTTDWISVTAVVILWSIILVLLLS